MALNTSTFWGGITVYCTVQTVEGVVEDITKPRTLMCVLVEDT